MRGVGRAVGVAQAAHFAVFCVNRLRGGAGDDADVVAFAQLLDQHFVRFQLRHEFQHGNAFDDTGEIQRRFNAAVTAADDRDVFVLEERAVAVRAEGDAVADVFFFAGDAKLAPFGTAGDDERAGLNRLAGVEQHFVRRPAFFHALHTQVFAEGNRVGGKVGVQFARQFRAGGFRHGDEVFDVHRVFHLTADAVGNEGDFQPFARRVDGR